MDVNGVVVGDGLGWPWYLHPQKGFTVPSGDDAQKRTILRAIESSRSIEKLFLFLWDADPEINTISVSGLETTKLVGCLLQSPIMQLYFLSGV